VRCKRVFLEMFGIMVPTDWARYQNFQTFEEFFGGLLVGVGRF
jgi:hypothetical protein